MYIKNHTRCKSYSPLNVLTFCLSPVRWASSTISFPNCEKQLTKSVKVFTEYSSFSVLETCNKEYPNQFMA